MMWIVYILTFMAGYLGTTFLFMLANEMMDSDSPWVMIAGLLLNAFLIGLAIFFIFWFFFWGR